MKFSVYLHQEYHDYLSCYGDINEVTNRILAQMRDMDIESIPNAPDRTGAKRLTINVTDEWYLDQVQAVPTNSPRWSLRKILYYVVDNELPAEWGWKITNHYVNKKETLLLKHIDNAITSITRAEALVKYETKEELQSVREQLQYIRSKRQ